MEKIIPHSPNTSKPHLWQRWLFICALAVQLLVASASITLMSSLRIVVGGESLWSKGISAALINLNKYAQTGSAIDIERFQKSFAITAGVSNARKALDAGGKDKQAIRQGLLQGENHPSDIDALLRILPYLWNLEALAPTQTLWRQADNYAQELNILAALIEDKYANKKTVSIEEIAQWQSEISRINESVMPLAKQFSSMLGKDSRDLGKSLLLTNLITALLLIFLYWISVERALKDSSKANSDLEAERLRSNITLASLGDGVITLDIQKNILYANPSALRLIGLPFEQVISRKISDILPLSKELFTTDHDQKSPSCANSNNENTVHWINRNDQEKVAVHISVNNIEQEGTLSATVLVLHDVSQEQNYMRMLMWQQSHDLLTGLDNRTAFEKYLQQILGKQQASLLHLNLDHFKIINASYGHAAGDEMLRQVCQQLRLALRESDVMARVGGDEFAVLLSHCQPHAAMQTAERLRKAIHDLNVQWRQHNLHSGVSIGVVHITATQSNDPQSLLGMADSACKHSKESGRNRITVYNPFNRIFQRYQGDMEWVQRLRNSLENNLFTLLAQTVYPLKSQGKGMGGVHFEVLIRLQDGFGKLISPNEFIPIAERYDLMPQIDRWVVRNALKKLKHHLSEGANISTCAINLSGASLGDTELLEFIRHNILEQGVAAEKICFEITETSAIASMDNAISMIEELRKLGCRFSLDDFGAGMASFKYLQQLPVDYLKIDGSFVKDMLRNKNNYAMVDAINHIGHVMGKSTVAEFVGDDETFSALQSMGVDYAQGYYIAPPIQLDSDYFIRASLPPPQIAPTPNTEHERTPNT